jgi:hypothetical protein
VRCARVLLGGLLLGAVVGLVLAQPAERHCRGARLWTDGRAWRVACPGVQAPEHAEPPSDDGVEEGETRVSQNR